MKEVPNRLMNLNSVIRKDISSFEYALQVFCKDELCFERIQLAEVNVNEPVYLQS